MSGESLALASAVLDGRIVVSGSQSARMAALLARQALEDTVMGLCGQEMSQASMRARLSYLRAFADSRTADSAAIAWNGLSQACHHHAYELTPSRGEVSHLIDLVATLRVAKP